MKKQRLMRLINLTGFFLQLEERANAESIPHLAAFARDRHIDFAARLAKYRAA